MAALYYCTPHACGSLHPSRQPSAMPVHIPIWDHIRPSAAAFQQAFQQANPELESRGIEHDSPSATSTLLLFFRIASSFTCSKPSPIFHHPHRGRSPPHLPGHSVGSARHPAPPHPALHRRRHAFELVDQVAVGLVLKLWWQPASSLPDASEQWPGLQGAGLLAPRGSRPRWWGVIWRTNGLGLAC